MEKNSLIRICFGSNEICLTMALINFVLNEPVTLCDMPCFCIIIICFFFCNDFDFERINP